MKVTQVSHSLTGGGAGIACARLHDALTADGIDSTVLTIAGPGRRDGNLVRFKPLLHAKARVLSLVERRIMALQRSSNRVHHSLGIWGSGLARSIMSTEPDVIHLHWVNNCCLSLAEIATLASRPLLWTLHDMWAFCGAEHYIGAYVDERYRTGYTPESRPVGESGWPINGWVWKQKLRALPRNIIYVSPSRWMAEQAKSSRLLQNRRVEVIPNGIDTDFWCPGDKEQARHELQLKRDEKVVLYSVAAGFPEWRKGGDLLQLALSRLGETAMRNLVCVTMGSVAPGQISDSTRAIGTGYLHEPAQIRRWFRAADLVVIPSRLDNFPNVALEAMACGVPCCGFDSGGLNEQIVDGVTGYVARREDVKGLADSINAILVEPKRQLAFGKASRARAIDKFSLPSTAAAHIKLYSEAKEQHDNA